MLVVGMKHAYGMMLACGMLFALMFAFLVLETDVVFISRERRRTAKVISTLNDNLITYDHNRRRTATNEHAIRPIRRNTVLGNWFNFGFIVIFLGFCFD